MDTLLKENTTGGLEVVKTAAIVIQRMKLSDCKLHPRNPRIHPEIGSPQWETLKASLEHDFFDPLVVNVRGQKNLLVSGHLRKKVLEASGYTHADVSIVDYDDATHIARMIAANKLQGEDDLPAVKDLLLEIDTGAIDMDLTGLSEIEIEQLMTAAPPEEAPEAQMDRAAELNKKWKVKTGDLWEIGEHRLLCGDSTKREDVKRVMGGKALLAAVDPPYNVGKNYGKGEFGDEKTNEEFEIFSRKWFSECQRVSQNQIVTPGCNNLASWCRWFEPFHISPWIKTNSMTNGKVSHFWCWEPLLFFGDKWKRKRSNDIFDFPIGKQKDVANHPCPKPLTMWKDLIQNFSDEIDLIYDGFCGSGTTMVACEQLKRKCRAIEISPAYCAVILDRMSAMGLHPKLL